MWIEFNSEQGKLRRIKVSSIYGIHNWHEDTFSIDFGYKNSCSVTKEVAEWLTYVVTYIEVITKAYAENEDKLLRYEVLKGNHEDSKTSQ